MEIICSHCGIILESEDDLSGQRVQCPNCNKEFIVNARKKQPTHYSAMSTNTYGDGRAKKGGAKWIIPLAVGVVIGVCATMIFMVASSARDAGPSTATDSKGISPLPGLATTDRHSQVPPNSKLYRLKYSTEVELVDGSSNDKNLEHLQAGTVLAFIRCDKESKINARLKESGMTRAEFTSSQPDEPVVFYAKIKLSDYYNGEFRDASQLFWSIRIDLLREESGPFRLTGYVEKNSKVGEEIYKLTRSGASVVCLIQLRSAQDKILRDLALITDFCPL